MASNTGDSSLTGSSLTSLIPAIRALCDLLTVSKVPGALIGGVAASLHGQARATEDVDALLRLDERTLEQFLPLAIAQGFRPRIPDAIAFARRSAVLLLEHETSRVGVDLTISRLPFDSEAIDRARPIIIEDLRFSVVAPEDLIIMKAIAHRPQDVQDIRAVVRANPQLDVKRIRTHVQKFAKVLDMPELWGDIAILFRHSQIRKKQTGRSEAKIKRKKK